MYKQQAIPNTIKFTSRGAVKCGDNYFTVEATEERIIPDSDTVDLGQEWGFLCDSVNSIIDTQIEDIYKTFKRK
jgi:hypothetical protein